MGKLTKRQIYIEAVFYQECRLCIVELSGIEELLARVDESNDLRDMILRATGSVLGNIPDKASKISKTEARLLSEGGAEVYAPSITYRLSSSIVYALVRPDGEGRCFVHGFRGKGGLLVEARRRGIDAPFRTAMEDLLVSVPSQIYKERFPHGVTCDRIPTLVARRLFGSDIDYEGPKEGWGGEDNAPSRRIFVAFYNAASSDPAVIIVYPSLNSLVLDAIRAGGVSHTAKGAASFVAKARYGDGGTAQVITQIDADMYIAKGIPSEGTVRPSPKPRNHRRGFFLLSHSDGSRLIVVMRGKRALERFCIEFGLESKVLSLPWDDRMQIVAPHLMGKDGDISVSRITHSKACLLQAKGVPVFGNETVSPSRSTHPGKSRVYIRLTNLMTGDVEVRDFSNRAELRSFVASHQNEDAVSAKPFSDVVSDLSDILSTSYQPIHAKVITQSKAVDLLNLGATYNGEYLLSLLNPKRFARDTVKS